MFNYKVSFVFAIVIKSSSSFLSSSNLDIVISIQHLLLYHTIFFLTKSSYAFSSHNPIKVCTFPFQLSVLSSLDFYTIFLMSLISPTYITLSSLSKIIRFQSINSNLYKINMEHYIFCFPGLIFISHKSFFLCCKSMISFLGHMNNYESQLCDLE